MFEVVAFFDGLLIGSPQAVGSFRVAPLSNESRLGAEADTTRAGLATFGISDGVSAERWTAGMRGHAPAAVINFDVEADGHEEARDLAFATARSLGDLLSLHRGARGDLFATYVRETGADSGRLYRNSTYSGNLATGFIAGEDPQTLGAHADAIRHHPLLREWVRLYAEAVGEKSPVFAYSRYWLLIESMAEALTPDLTLAEIDAPEGAGSTWRRVVALIRARSTAGRGEAWVAPYGEMLWEVSGAWYGYRNAAMHHGGFSPESELQQRQAWFDRVKEAADKASADGTWNTLQDPYLRSLRDTGKILLHWELDAAAGFFDPGAPIPIALRS